MSRPERCIRSARSPSASPPCSLRRRDSAAFRARARCRTAAIGPSIFPPAARPSPISVTPRCGTGWRSQSAIRSPRRDARALEEQGGRAAGAPGPKERLILAWNGALLARLSALAPLPLALLGELQGDVKLLDEGLVARSRGLVYRQENLVAQPAIELGHVEGMNLVSHTLTRIDLQPGSLELLAQRGYGLPDGLRRSCLARPAPGARERCHGGDLAAVVQQDAKNVRFERLQGNASALEANDVAADVELEILLSDGARDRFASRHRLDPLSSGREQELRRGT